MPRCQTILNRRRFCGLVAALPIAVAVPTVRADTPDADYETGTNLLKSGREYLKAIAALERAVQAKPDNAAYQSALGCAYAARFASLCSAIGSVSYAEAERRNYEDAKARWYEVQKLPPKQRDNTPPVPPRPAATLDDDIPIALGRKSVAGNDGEAETYAVAANSVRETALQMGRKSVAAFSAAHRLAAQMPPSQKAAVEFERGWGQLFLWQSMQNCDLFSENGARGTSYVAAPCGLTDDLLTEPFDVCVRADENNADYWHSLAISRVPRYALMTGGISKYSAELRQSALAAFDRAFALRPNDWNVRFQSAIVMAQTLGLIATADRLEQVARKTNNVVLWNFAVWKRFQAAPFPYGSDALSEKAFAAVEQGGRAANHEGVYFVFPIPPLLHAAWKIDVVDAAEELQYQTIANYELEVFDHMPVPDGKPETDKVIARAATAFISAQTLQLKEILAIRAKQTVSRQEDLIAGNRLHSVLSILSLVEGRLKSAQGERFTEQKARLLRDVAALKKQSGYYHDFETFPR